MENIYQDILDQKYFKIHDKGPQKSPMSKSFQDSQSESGKSPFLSIFVLIFCTITLVLEDQGPFCKNILLRNIAPKQFKLHDKCP